MTFKYTPEQRAWLDDLKKTRAKQGRGLLHGEDGWCCLGRACHVLKVPSSKEDGEEIEFFGEGDDSDEEILPKYVKEILHLRWRNGEANETFSIGGEQYDSLVSANDNGCTFKQIAEAIEADPENFFTRGAE